MGASLFSTYASLSTSLTLLQQAYYQFIPTPVRHYIATILHRILSRRSPKLFTLIVEEYNGLSLNPLFNSLQLYLCNKITSHSSSIVKATTESNDVNEPVSLHLVRQETFKEVFNGFEVCWMFRCTDLPAFGSLKKPKSRTSWNADDLVAEDHVLPEENRFFELSFFKAHKDDFFASYLPQVMEVAAEIVNKDKVLKIWTLKYTTAYDKKAKWESVKLNHPSTFDSLALEPSVKEAIIEDLDRFLGRKEFYRKVGRAWKRGYLLHGPPGTGKSSLIAAIANYLKFDVYDLQLMHIDGDDMLRKLLLSTTNRSILVIEDIDCSMGLPKKRKRIGGDGNDSEDEDDSDQSDDEKGTANPTYFYNDDRRRQNKSNISLSGLLNFIDGLWSSCGDERIIIFTTNHKDRIDPALLRPGRMDMHIHMSYLGMPAFVTLASNYLGIPTDSVLDHPLSEKIERMLQTTNVTPAEVAEELMKGKDVDTALEGVLGFLKRKRVEMETEKQEKEKAKRIRKMKKEEKAKEKVLNAMEALGKGIGSISTEQLKTISHVKS